MGVAGRSERGAIVSISGVVPILVILGRDSVRMLRHSSNVNKLFRNSFLLFIKVFSFTDDKIIL